MISKILSYKNTFPVIFLFVFTTIVLPQSNGDFPISQLENNPSSFIQNQPKLFPFSSGKFLTTWKDYREGVQSTYAQWFDSLGGKVGTNFEIYDDDEIIFGKDGSTLLVNAFGAPYFITEYGYFIYSRITDKLGSTSNEFFVYMVNTSGMDVDPLGVDYKCLSKSNQYVFIIRIDGYLNLLYYNHDGFIKERSFYNYILTRATNIDCAVDMNDNYSICQFNARYNPENNLPNPVGIYYNLFDSNDSLLVNSQMIKEFKVPDDFQFSTWDSPILKCINIGDSLWQIFWLDKLEKSFNSVRIDYSGNLVAEINTIQLPESISTDVIDCFSLTPMQNKKFLIYLSTQGIIPNTNINTYYHSLFFFDSRGNLIDQQSTQIGFYSPLAFKTNNIFHSLDKSILAVSSDDKDVFLNSFKDFALTNNQKINDDTVGSNESNPEIFNVDENTFFVSWKNETTNYGAEVDKNGIVSDEINKLDGNSFCFLPNGNCFNFWTIQIEEGDIINARQGYTVYNKNWEVIKKDTVVYSLYPVKMLRLSETKFIMYYLQGANLNLILIDENGNQMNSKTISLTIYDEVKIYRVDDETFLVNNITENQYYNAYLEPVSNSFTLPYFHYYIGKNRFLQFWNDYVDWNLTAHIMDSTGSIIRDVNFNHDFNIWNIIKLISLPSGGFAILYSLDDNVYVKTFSQDGLPLTLPYQIHSNNAGVINSPTLAVNNNKILFAWSDNRIQNAGYNVFGSIFNTSKLVNVGYQNSNAPSEYLLYQNYPNPFNPSTKIKYYIPVNSNKLNGKTVVSLKVYDILGNEITTLINEEKPAGEYEVVFNAANYASGFYFYVLHVDGKTISRKMCLLK